METLAFAAKLTTGAMLIDVAVLALPDEGEQLADTEQAQFADDTPTGKLMVTFAALLSEGPALATTNEKLFAALEVPGTKLVGLAENTAEKSLCRASVLLTELLVLTGTVSLLLICAVTSSDGELIDEA